MLCCVFFWLTKADNTHDKSALKEDTPKDAIAAFQKVVSMEPEKGEW